MATERCFWCMAALGDARRENCILAGASLHPRKAPFCVTVRSLYLLPCRLPSFGARVIWNVPFWAGIKAGRPVGASRFRWQLSCFSQIGMRLGKLGGFLCCPSCHPSTDLMAFEMVVVVFVCIFLLRYFDKGHSCGWGFCVFPFNCYCQT